MWGLVHWAGYANEHMKSFQGGYNIHSFPSIFDQDTIVWLLFYLFIYLFLRTYYWLVLYRMEPWERHLWIRKHPTKEMPTTSSTLTFFANF